MELIAILCKAAEPFSKRKELDIKTMKGSSRIFALLTVASLLLPNATLAKPPVDPAKTIQLFNGENLDGFYTFLKDRGRDNDPKKVFTVSDSMIRISGEEWGCITSNDEFENYHLVAEYKWGTETHANRKDSARDSGILIHSVGKDGAYGGIWMYSIEVQMIEGGTGDLLVVADNSDDFAITCPVAPGTPHVFQEGGRPVTIHGGRINWWGRDPDWKDVKGFRGPKDVENPIGQWNRLECTADGDNMTVLLNGKVMTTASNVRPHKGKIQIQSEGAELFVRKVDLIPLKR
jgi:hypothetical protein